LTRKKLRPSRAASAAAILGLALSVSACGTGGVDKSSNVAGGKDLFVSKCGSCHTLADAGTTGKVGPDLDAAFGPSREQGLEESTVRQVVRDQIHYPSPAQGSPGFPVMPANLVTGSDADAVSAYVASVAGVGAAPGPPAPPPPPPPPGPPPPPPPPSPTTGQTTTTGPTPSGGDAANGKSLFASLACGSCHSIDGSSGVGPTLKGLFGAKVELTDGKTVTADDAYLLEAIEDPDAEIVKGYQPGIMSGVIKPHQVAESDARDLIAYIKTLK
jgi:cytochrome c2